MAPASRPGSPRHEAVEKLRDWTASVAHMKRAAGLLMWDRATGTQPAGRAERNAQLAELQRAILAELRRPELDEVLSDVEEHGGQDSAVQFIATQARRYRRRALAVPATLAANSVAAAAECHTALMRARSDRTELSVYLQRLGTLIELKREESAFLAVGDEAYDAFLYEWEAGLTATAVERVVKRDPASSPPPVTMPDVVPGPDPDLWGSDFPARALAVGDLLGVDRDRIQFKRGSESGTTTVGPDDIRISISAREDPVADVIALAHELGHALLEQHSDPIVARFTFPEAPSAVAHETVARFLEKHVAREPGFWEAVGPLLGGLSATELHARALHASERIAPEGTSDAHAEACFRLELGLFRRLWNAADLPDAAHELTGSDATETLLRDTLWSHGVFGYYPCYLLASRYSDGLREQFEERHGPMRVCLMGGDLSSVGEFLSNGVLRAAPIQSAARHFGDLS